MGHEADCSNLRRLVLLVPVLDFGGVETRVAIQSELMRQGRYEIRVCTFWKAGAAAERVRAAGVPVDVLGVNPSIRNPRATWALQKYLRRMRPDILHARIGEANFHGMIAGAAARVPLRIAEEVGIPQRSGLGRRMYSAVYRLAHRVVGVSEATCQYLVEQDGAAAERVVRVYNTADPAYFDAEPAERNRGEAGPFRILVVGRLAEVKNQGMLLEAFAAAVDGGGQAELAVAGDGPLRAELEAKAEPLGITDRVQFLGFRDDVRHLLAEADLFVLPSKSEGFGIVLIEAMGMGVPVLGSRLDALDEVIGELGEEYRIAPDDTAGWTSAIRRMIELPEQERRAIGMRGREIAVRKFSPEAYVRNLERLYENRLPVWEK